MFLCQALEATTSGRIHAWQSLIMSDIYELSVWQNLPKHSILQSISGVLDLFQRASLLNGAHSLVVAQGMLRPVFPILCLSASSASPTEKFSRISLNPSSHHVLNGNVVLQHADLIDLDEHVKWPTMGRFTKDSVRLLVIFQVIQGLRNMKAHLGVEDTT